MRPFLESLGELLGDERLEHYTAVLADLCQEITEKKRGGGITLSINLSPNGDTTFKVSADLKSKAPREVFGERIVYHTANGDILRENPNQRKLPFVARANGEAVVENGGDLIAGDDVAAAN